jgi:NACHT domain/TIR domain
MQQLSLPASVFCLAASSDADLLAEWERHLKPLVQARHITLWSERHLMAGSPRMQQIHDRLDHADLLVLLLSSDFFDDNECYALMERAIKRAERGEARLIPLLLCPVAWHESPLAPYPCTPSNSRPVTEWSNRDAAFEACVRDIRHLLGRPITAPLTRPHTRTEALQNQNRIRMLRRVRKTWIDGLLMQSLHDAARIELHLQDRPDVLDTPLRLQVQELDQAPKTLPDGTTIVQVYDEADEELLILGEPGAGKTTLLLELTRTLLERAEHDEQFPLPVIFNLSSWAEKREPLHAWLIEELRRIYQVPRKIGKAWIDADHILPLLDGLDEVAKDARSACVKEINAYYQTRLERGNSPIVVCCRSEEYTTLSTHVMLQHAVSILPLTDAQINAYLEQAGEQVKGLRQALEEDTELHNLARQPLMLNIFTLAYQGARALDVPTGETREGMRHTIFARYVERMLKRRGQLKRWNAEQMMRWLAFLARQIQCHDQVIFSLENLQPNWLSGISHILYRWCIGVVLSFGLGLSVGCIFGLPAGLIIGLLIGLPAGLTTAALFSSSILVKK